MTMWDCLRIETLVTVLIDLVDLSTAPYFTQEVDEIWRQLVRRAGSTDVEKLIRNELLRRSKKSHSNL